MPKNKQKYLHKIYEKNLQKKVDFFDCLSYN